MICNLPCKQLSSEDRGCEIELSSRYPNDEFFKLEGTVGIPKDLHTRVQQHLNFMTSVFRHLNGSSQCQSSLVTKSSVKQRLFNDDNTPQTSPPQGLIVENLFVRDKALGRSGVELASRQSFIQSSKSKISEVKGSDSGYWHQENGSNVDPSTKDNSQPESNVLSLERKCRRRYRLVRRRSASCKAQGQSSSTMSEHNSRAQENPRVANSDHSFDQCLSDTDDHHVHKRTKKMPVKYMRQNKCQGSPELDDVMLLEAPPSPVANTKVQSSQAVPRNRTSPSTMLSQENGSHSSSNLQRRYRHETLFESSQEHCCSSTPKKFSGINDVERSQVDAGRQQHNGDTFLEEMPSPIVPSDGTKEGFSDLLKHHIKEADVSKKGPGESNQHKNFISSNVKQLQANSASTRNCQIISDFDYGESKSKVGLRFTNGLLVNSPEGGPTTQLFTNQYERKSQVITSKNLKRRNQYCNRPNGASINNEHTLQVRSTPHREKYHPSTTCHKSRTPAVISPNESFTIRAPLISPFQHHAVKSSRPRWTTLDRSPMTLCAKQPRRLYEPIVASRKNLQFDDFGSDNERAKARDTNSDCNSNYPSSKCRRQQNYDSECSVEDDEFPCSTGACTKTFCFNCSTDLS
jgi:hypothetical protein